MAVVPVVRPQAGDVVGERQALREPQHPKVAVLACSDSRVAPEIVFDQPLGSLFVVVSPAILLTSRPSDRSNTPWRSWAFRCTSSLATRDVEA